MNAQAKIYPLIRHESSTGTGLDHEFAFHCGPRLIISGEVVTRSDHSGVIACPTHNKYYRVEYNAKTNEITTESSKSLLDVYSYPSGVGRKVFLNISLNQQKAADFDENPFERISLFDKSLAGHLSYIDPEDYQGGERDATFYYDGEILDIDTHYSASSGAYCNFERTTVLIELNPNDEFEANLALLDIKYAVPSKHINDIENFYAPCPEVKYYSFKNWDEYMKFKLNP